MWAGQLSDCLSVVLLLCVLPLALPGRIDDVDDVFDVDEASGQEEQEGGRLHGAPAKIILDDDTYARRMLGKAVRTRILADEMTREANEAKAAAAALLGQRSLPSAHHKTAAAAVPKTKASAAAAAAAAKAKAAAAAKAKAAAAAKAKAASKTAAPPAAAAAAAPAAAAKAPEPDGMSNEAPYVYGDLGLASQPSTACPSGGYSAISDGTECLTASDALNASYNPENNPRISDALNDDPKAICVMEGNQTRVTSSPGTTTRAVCIKSNLANAPEVEAADNVEGQDGFGSEVDTVVSAEDELRMEVESLRKWRQSVDTRLDAMDKKIQKNFMMGASDKDKLKAEMTEELEKDTAILRLPIPGGNSSDS